MADEKKPGLLKRMFSFGFGKKKAEPDVDDNAVAEAEAQAAKEAELAAAEAQATLEREAELERQRELERQAEEQRLAAEAAAIEQAEKEAVHKAELEKAEALRHAEEEKAERLEQERLAAQAKAEQAQAEREQADAEAAEKAKLAQENADAEEAARLKLEAEQEAQRLADEKAESEKAELAAQAEAERVEAERLEAEKLEQEKAEQAEAERLERLEAVALQQAENEEAERLEAVLQQTQDEEFENESIDEVASEPALRQAQDEGEEERKVGWFKRLTKGLARSSNALTENITSVFTKKKLDEETLQELEDILIQADLGVETAMNITDTLASQRMGKDVTDEEVRQVMAEEIQKVLEPVAQPLELDLDHQPHVILVVGVNGSGKTTTIGKISQKLYNAGFSTLLVAGDTFRAAAVEQLHIWGDRTQAPVMSRPNGSDAAGLAYDAYSEAVEQKRDVMLMDTAGRLQNKKELMDELEKIIRVLKKQDETAPHTVLLTLDATTGQNALNQVEIFKDVAGVNGLVMTKLDGTARGGILVSISAKHKLPVYFIGVGEQVEDLEPFEADVFAKAIAGIE